MSWSKLNFIFLIIHTSCQLEVYNSQRHLAVQKWTLFLHITPTFRVRVQTSNQTFYISALF